MKSFVCDIINGRWIFPIYYSSYMLIAGKIMDVIPKCFHLFTLDCDAYKHAKKWHDIFGEKPSPRMPDNENFGSKTTKCYKIDSHTKFEDTSRCSSKEIQCNGQQKNDNNINHVFKLLHRKRKIVQHERQEKGNNWGDMEWEAVPAPLMVPVVLRLWKSDDK